MMRTSVAWRTRAVAALLTVVVSSANAGMGTVAFAAPSKGPAPATTATTPAAPTTAPAAPGAAPAAPAVDDKMTEARKHYDRGLELYDEGAYDGARVEFNRAYELAPTYRILYNIALVQKQQADLVGALRSFESYLADGGSQIPDVRQKEVQGEIALLRSRVASLTVTVNIAGADIAVDDVPVGRSPLKEPLLVNPGRRKISATKAGRIPATKTIEVVGSDQRQLSLELGERAVVIINKPSRRIPWVGWIATGVFAIGAGITGYTAVKTNSNLNDALGSPNASASDLSSQKSKVRTFSILADSLTLATVIAGGISAYYTIKWGREDSAREKSQEKGASAGGPNTLRLGVSGPGVGAWGTF